MKNVFLFFCLSMLMISCGSSRKIASKNKVSKSSTYKAEASPKAKRVADYALNYQGTKYKYGGTTKRGMDCSGLLYVSFQQENIQLPRTSRAMANEGRRIRVSDITIGDLVFFQTNKSKKVINHVGMVVEIVPGNVSFIHSTTSRGVIVSSLNENYWNKAFIMARRIF